MNPKAPSPPFERGQHPRSTWPDCLLLALASGALGGCSVLYDLSADQCQEQADCDSFGSDYVCNAAKICVPSNAGNGGTGGSSGTGGTGGSDTGGTGGGGSGGTGVDAGMGGSTIEPECTSNAQCINESGGGAFICRNESCLELTTDRCPFVIGEENLAAPSPFIVGAFTFIPPESAQNSPVTANYDLAIREFTQEVAGIPTGPSSPAGVTEHPVVAIACDGFNEVDQSLAHLIDVVGVPGVVAPLPAADLRAAFLQYAPPNHDVFFLSAVDADSRLTTIDDQDLLWHMLGSAEGLAPPYAPLLARTEAYLKAQAGGPSTLRVAMIDDESAFMQDISSVLTQSLRFNDMSVVQNLDAGNYLGVPSIPEPYAGDDTPYVEAIASLASFEPHVVVSITYRSFVTEILSALETLLEEDEKVRPFYLLSPTHQQLDELYTLLIQNQGWALNQRMLGVNFESNDSAVLDDYRVRFSNDYEMPTSYENFYDAMMFMIFAAVAANDGIDLSGQDLADGMRRMIDTTSPSTYNLLPDELIDLAGFLGTRGPRAQVVGTLGAPNFDLSTGARETQGSVYCVGPFGPSFDEMRYDPGTLTLSDPQTGCAPF